MKISTLINLLITPIGIRLVRATKRKRLFDLSRYPDVVKPVEPKYLNIGALDFPHPLWHNLDNPTEMEAFRARQAGNIHIHHDLMSERPIPLAINSLSIAYCSHVIEHLRDSDVKYMFNEVYRILRPGGTFRLVAPDMGLFYDAYQRSDVRLFSSGLTLYDCPSVEQKLILQFASSLVRSHPENKERKFTDSEIKNVFETQNRDDFFEFFRSRIDIAIQKKYPADHINWFTPQKTGQMLKSAGFYRVDKSAHGQSALPPLRDITLFDPYCDHSLYFECVK